MTVVKSAMITSMQKTLSGMTPKSLPKLMAIKGHKGAGIHEGADASRFAHGIAAKPRGEAAAAELADDGRDGHQTADSPERRTFHAADIRSKPRVGKENREEECGHEIAQSAVNGGVKIPLRRRESLPRETRQRRQKLQLRWRPKRS